MNKMLNIISKKNIWLSISGVFIAVSLVFLIIWGLNLGIDFTGGSLLEVRFTESVPAPDQVKSSLAELGLEGEVTVQPTEQVGYIIRFQDITEETHQEIVLKLKDSFPATEDGGVNLEEERFEAIGPSIGQELRSRAIYAILIVLIAIVAYIAWAFRKISWPIKSWKYGVIAVVTLFHDIFITLGIFALLGAVLKVEVGLPFVAALLTILGYSVNDTIVVFDRIRENLSRLSKSDFEGLVNRSVNETITRSINTSLTTLLVLLAIFFFGGVTIKYFILALICGVALGTYSSIFVASPLLVVWERFSRK